MNKSLIITKSIVIAISMVGITFANNFSHHSVLNNWTGFYAGVDAGLVINNAQLKSQQLGFTNPSGACNTSSDISTFSPGIQLGYLYQFSNNFVSGIEANAILNTHQNGTLSCDCPITPGVSDSFLFKNQIQTSIKGRFGRTMDWNKNIFLPYLTAGASFANLGLTYKNEGGDYYSQNTTQAGWLIGAGVEWAFRQDLSLRVEYAYINYGNAISMNLPSIYNLIDTNGQAHVNLSSNNIAISINYWI